MYDDELCQPVRKKKNRLGKILVAVQAAVTTVFVLLLAWLDLLPLRYVAAVGGILGMLWVFAWMSQCFRVGRGVGKVYALLMICVLGLGVGYLWKTGSMLSNLTGGELLGFTSDVDVAEEPFTVYISGNDSYGEVSMEEGRSDVNILMTVNPRTRQILMTTMPRDYYVELPFGEGCWDKLTHAGNYGIECSMQTLSALYDVEIDYYLRVNFSGFESIVEALGGVDVYSEYAFSTNTGHQFVQGYNAVDGPAALAFVRERYAFEDGDVQRGKNQMAMIQAIMDKAMSPALLTGYMDLMDSVSGSFVTNMPKDSVGDLMKLQLLEGGAWNVVTNSVSGYVSEAYTYSDSSQMLSVMLQDEVSVQHAAELIDRCENGEILSE